MLDKNSQNNTPKPKTRRTCGAEVAGIKFSVNASKSVSPISRLSDDVLAMIFQEYYKLMTDPPDRPSCPYGWIRITHVCHRWRGLAISMAVLWSTFVIGRPKVARVFFSRSKSAPLTIKVPSSTKDKLICDIFGAFARIRDIELNTRFRDYLPMESQFPNEAPLLRRIVIRCHEAFNRSKITQGRKPLPEKPIPTVFDRCSLPSLTSLSIEGFIPQWQNHIFVPTLTHLTVHSISKDNHGTGSILDALDKMKNLRLLDLSFNCTTLNWSGPRTNRRISLPKLGHLALCDSTNSCTYLLERINHPPTTTIFVTLPTGRSEPAASFSSLSSVTFNKLSAEGVPEILTVTLSRDDLNIEDILRGSPFHLAFWDQIIDTTNIPWRAVKPLFHFQITDTNFVDMLEHGLSLGPLSQTQALYIGGRIDYYEDPWEVVKECMPDVRTLHMYDPDLVVLERLLSRDILHKSKRTSQTKPFCPNLRTLILENADFEYLVMDCLDYGLSSRKKSGRPIHTLRLFDCSNITGDSLDSFEVDEVDWDGFEFVDESEFDLGEYGSCDFFRSSDEER